VRRQQIPFVLVLVAVALLALVMGWQWGFRTRIFPTIVAVAVVVFALAHLVTLVRTPVGVPAGGTPETGQQAAEVDEEPVSLRSAARFMAWLLAFAVALWAVGFLWGGVGLTVAYMLLDRRESLTVTAAMAAAVGGLIWVLDAVLGVPFPAGALL
jgi:hypothetical protein